MAKTTLTVTTRTGTVVARTTEHNYTHCVIHVTTATKHREDLRLELAEWKKSAERFPETAEYSRRVAMIAARLEADDFTETEAVTWHHRADSAVKALAKSRGDASYIVAREVA